MGEELDTAQVAALGQRMDAMRVKFMVPAQGALRRAKVDQVAGDDPGQLSGIVEGRARPGPRLAHVALDPVGDRQLSDAEWGAITQGAMDRMGFTEAAGKAPVRWVAVRHGVSEGGHEHVRIAATIVRTTAPRRQCSGTTEGVGLRRRGQSASTGSWSWAAGQPGRSRAHPCRNRASKA